MRLVFEKFEKSLALRTDAINVLKVEDPSLFARCALSLAQGFPSDALEPACIFSDDDREISMSKVLYFVGDALCIDLNDKRIVAAGIKSIVNRMLNLDGEIDALEKKNFEMESVFENQFVQMSADYVLADSWDATKYLKMLGFGVDDSGDVTVYDKVQHFLRIAADLFPEKIIAFVNLQVYLTRDQYVELCKMIASLELCVLSYEQGVLYDSEHFENVLFIDANYLER